MERPLVIYHANCPDGFGAAVAAYCHFRQGDDCLCDFVAASFGQPPPEVTERQVYILDFSYARPVLKTMCRSAQTVTILDHHLSAEQDLAGLEKEHANLRVVFDMDKSGSVLTWEFFHHQPPPRLLLHIQDRDLWRFALEGTNDLYAALQARPFDFQAWAALIDGGELPASLFAEGEAINRYRREVIALHRDMAVIGTIDGCQVPIVNCYNEIASDLLGELAEGHPFAVGYQDQGTLRKWSLRSSATGADVAEIATRFGGGGHQHAAGFITHIPDGLLHISSQNPDTYARLYQNPEEGESKLKEAENILRYSEERYRALFRDNPTMIVTLNSDLAMLSVNPACASQLGYTIDELEGQSVLHLFHQEDRLAVTDLLRKCLQNPYQVHRWQFRKIRKDGQLLWVEEIAQGVYDLNGILNLLVVCQDITARKRAEEERGQLLLELEAVLENIFEGVVLFDLEGGILTMNPAAMAFHDYESIEQVRQLRNQYQETFELTDLEGRPVPFEQWPVARAIRGERFVDYEVRVRRKDTGKSWVGSYSGTPVQTRLGDIILAVNTMRDISERKRAESEREQLLLQLEAVLENINEGVVISDLDGNILTMNKEALVLHEFKNIEQARMPLPEYQGTFELFDLEGRPMPLADWPMSRALRGERYVDDEVRVRHKVTGKSWVGSYSGMQVSNNSGDIILNVITVRDISERKFAEEEIARLNVSLAARAADLEGANQELEAFNYSVAHDLRTPLNTLSLSSQAIDMMCNDRIGEECKGYIRNIYKSTLHMNELIDALLTFSRMGHVEPHREKIDLSLLAQEVVTMLQEAEPERQIDFRISDRIEAHGDARLLRVVLDNIFGNAWKYTFRQEKAVIEFGARVIDGELTYFVQDNGIGFDKAQAAKLFVPFQRLPGAETSKGFGIGLATVERIIKRHGGRIWAEGEPGKGACFYFTLAAV